MRKDIHPKYQSLKIKIGKDEFLTSSTLPSGEILMDVDFRKHPAWNKSTLNVVNQSNKNVSDFNKKFAGLSFGVKKELIIIMLFSFGLKNQSNKFAELISRHC